MESKLLFYLSLTWNVFSLLCCECSGELGRDVCGAKVWRGHRGNTGASDLRCDKLKEDSVQFYVDSTLALLS